MDQKRYKPQAASNEFEVIVDPDMPLVLSEQKLKTEVDACWENLKRHGTNLYDGLIFSANIFEKHRIIGCFIPYRYYVAWRRRPELRSKIPIKPLCVSGITHTYDEILIGKRAPHVHLFPNHYEFAPSGGVDKESEKNGRIDYCDLVLRELNEETGLTSNTVDRLNLFSVIEDIQEESLELCFDIAIKKRFTNLLPSAEYSALIPWKKEALNSFLTQQANDWVPFSKQLWQAWQKENV